MSEQDIRTPDTDEVLRAAAYIVDAFQATDTDRYFAAFAPDATFVFHPEPARLDSRKEYENLWSGWVADGWHVVNCDSTHQRAQVFPGGAVFSHTVATTVSIAGEEESYEERETIVFRTVGAELIAVHEHLSAPTSEPTPATESTSALTGDNAS